MDAKLHAPTGFGTYVEAREDAVITNDMKSRPDYLGTTGNIQGTHKVYDIHTRKVKKPRTITEFPMPEQVITLVNEWGNVRKFAT